MKRIFVISVLFLLSIMVYPQWISTNDNITNVAGSLRVNNGNLYCLQPFSGVYRSQDVGQTWQMGNKGLSNNIFIEGMVFIDESILILTDDSQIFRSDNDGESWEFVYQFNDLTMMTLYFDDTVLYSTGALAQIYTSTDHGLTWSLSNNGIQNPYIEINGYCQNSEALFIYSYDELYKSIDHGTNWNKIVTGAFPMYYKKMLAYDGTVLLVNGQDDLIISEDNGLTWNILSGASIYGINSLAYIDNRIIAATIDGIYEFVNQSEFVRIAMANYSLKSIVKFNDYYLTSSDNSGNIFQSTNFFTTWEKVNHGISTNTSRIIQSLDDRLLATDVAGVYVSDNDGAKWDFYESDIIQGSAVSFWEQDGILLYSTGWSCYQGLNQGEEWVEKNPRYMMPVPFYDFYKLDSLIYFACEVGIFRSVNEELEEWDDLSEDLTYGTFPYLAVHSVFCIDTLYNQFFIGTDTGVYRSNNMGDDWIFVKKFDNARKMVSINNKLILFTDEGWFVSDSTGMNWEPYISSLHENLHVSTFYKYEHYLFVGSIYSGAFLSSDGGETWENISGGIESFTVNSFVVHDPYLYIGTDHGVWKRPFSEVSVFENILESSQLYVYPNPTNDIIHIDLISGSSYLCLYDLSGKLLLKKNFQGDKAVIHLNSFNPGIYILRVKSEKGNFTQKVIKN